MKRLLTVLLAIVLLVGCFAACSGENAADLRPTDDVYGDGGSLAGENYFDSGYKSSNAEATSQEPGSSLTVDRKIIRDAELTLETKSFDDALASLDAQVKKLGGYVQSSETDANSSYRESDLVLRLPADKLDTFLTSVGNLGTVTRQSIDAKDVTDTYVDVESRLATLKAEQEALTELLKNAGSLSDILSIRDRLADVTANLESYQARLNAMDSQIAYSTVTISLYEVELMTSTEGGFWEEVGTRFVNNLARIGKGLRGFAVWFMGAVPWFVLLGAIAVAIVLIVRGNVRRRRRRRQKRQEQEQQQQQ